MEEDDFRNNGGVMNHETLETMSKRRKPFTVDYAGFGWLMIRQGVFEQIEYPFFKPQWHTLKKGTENEIVDFSSEDATFFLEMREKGIKCYIDPNVNVGHEKMCVLAYNPAIHDRKPE